MFDASSKDETHILVRTYSIVVTVVTGLALYLVPPTIAVLLLWTGLQVLFGNSPSHAQQLIESSAATQFAYICITEAIVVAALVVLMKVTRLTWNAIGLRVPKFADISYVIGGIAVYYAIFIVIALLARIVLPIDFDQKQQIGFDTDTTGVGIILAFMSLVVLPPVVEEILFRGYLYTRFKQVLSIRWAAVVVSVLFGAAHLQFGSGNALLWLAAIDTTILSFVLVYLREKTGTIWAGVGVHALKNFIAFMILFNVVQ